MPIMFDLASLFCLEAVLSVKSNYNPCQSRECSYDVHIERQHAQSINISKHPSRPTSTYKYKYKYTYINLNTKCSTLPHIDTYMRIPKHVSGLLISLWRSANSLFVRDKYATPTGKRLYASYVQKVEAHTNIPVDTTAHSKQHVGVVQW